MAGYLEQYGAGEEGRERAIKRALVAAVIASVVTSGLYLFFRNYRQEQQVQRFLEALARKDYTEAYQAWGCTDAKPCRDYSRERFLEDWGPNSARADGRALHVVDSESCGSGVIFDLELGSRPDEKLWVERGTLAISFSPWPECPFSRPISKFWKNMERRFKGRAMK